MTSEVEGRELRLEIRSMTQKHEPDGKNIEPGMVVEATKGDLGEEDVSKPKVSAVVQDQQGNVEKLLVHKGVIFKKTLEIPADRIQSVDEAHMDENTSGKVTVEVSKQEAASLTAVGEDEQAPLPRGKPSNFFFRVLGPGFLGGMAGNDSSAVAAYSVDGATNGYGHLWLLLLSTPLYQSVQFACAKLGRVTQKGLAEILREHYSRWVAIPVLLASTSYAVAGTVGWPAGLSKKPWQNEGFYLILTGAGAASLIIALLHFDPIRLIFWANVLSGVLAPVLVVYLLVIGNNRKIMRNQRLGQMTNIGLVVTALVMFTAAILLFYRIGNWARWLGSADRGGRTFRDGFTKQTQEQTLIWDRSGCRFRRGLDGDRCIGVTSHWPSMGERARIQASPSGVRILARKTGYDRSWDANHERRSGTTCFACMAWI
jgi:hypothetical protein